MHYTASGMFGRSVYAARPAEQFNEVVSKLPTAELRDVVVDGVVQRDFRAVKVTAANGQSKVVHIPSDRYAVVQHAAAFRPIVEGLTQAGIHDWHFVLDSSFSKARALILAGDNQATDSVQLGFQIRNSYDGSEALSYGFKAGVGQTTVEVVGYRQVCSNGMKIKVPLDQAEFVGAEVKVRIKEILSEQRRFVHTTNVHARIQLLQHVVEALGLLRDPISRYIERAKAWSIKDREMLTALIKRHVGERYAQRVERQYFLDTGKEGRSLWSLYNAITYVASHDVDKLTARESLIDKAADMLNEELQVAAR